MNKSVCITGVVLILITIILGAFGAHALKELLNVKELSSFETGARYSMYHGLAFLILGLSAERLPKIVWVYRFLLAGIILFSGSLFLLATQSLLGLEMKFLGPVTPIGGIFLLTGWSILLISLARKS